MKDRHLTLSFAAAVCFLPTTLTRPLATLSRSREREAVKRRLVRRSRSMIGLSSKLGMVGFYRKTRRQAILSFGQSRTRKPIHSRGHTSLDAHRRFQMAHANKPFCAMHRVFWELGNGRLAQSGRPADHHSRGRERSMRRQPQGALSTRSCADTDTEILGDFRAKRLRN
jgi:hypothetical protein